MLQQFNICSIWICWSCNSYTLIKITAYIRYFFKYVIIFDIDFCLVLHLLVLIEVA